MKIESQLLSPTEKATFGLGAAAWGYGARVVGWEVRFIVFTEKEKSRWWACGGFKLPSNHH